MTQLISLPKRRGCRAGARETPCDLLNHAPKSNVTFASVMFRYRAALRARRTRPRRDRDGQSDGSGGGGEGGELCPALCPAFSTQAPLSDEARRNICAGRGFCSKMGCRQEASCSRPAMKSAAGWRSDGKPSVGLEGFKLIASWQELLSRRGKPLKASMRLRICVVCCSFLIPLLPKPGLAGSRLVKPFGFRAP